MNGEWLRGTGESQGDKSGQNVSGQMCGMGKVDEEVGSTRNSRSERQWSQKQNGEIEEGRQQVEEKERKRG